MTRGVKIAPAESAATADLIVVLPGIQGSTLVKEGREVWAPSAGSVVRAIASFGSSVQSLTLPPDLGDDDPGDGVKPGRLMPDLHLIPGLWSVNLGYGVLLDRLRSILRASNPADADGDEPPNLLAVPYDWRLSNRLNARRVKGIVEPALERLRARGGTFGDARVTFVCHSMGGLVARWYVEKEGGREVTRKLITLGTPHRGALKAVCELVNGVERGFGPLRLDLTGFARSLPSAYQLLPEYACIESERGLLKMTEVSVPALDPTLVRDGARFHAELDEAWSKCPPDGVDLNPVVGTKQSTQTTAQIDGDKLVPEETIKGDDERGDATVPRLSATPRGLSPDSGTIHWVAARHGALQSAPAALDHLEGIITARTIIHRALPLTEICLRVPELVLAGADVLLEARLEDDVRATLQVAVTDERGTIVDRQRLKGSGPTRQGVLRSLRPGGYRVTVGGYGVAATQVAAVISPLVVWAPETA